jgi:hypothetical protein
MANRPQAIVPQQPNYNWTHWVRSEDPVARFFRRFGERFVHMLESAERHPNNVNNNLLGIINHSLNQWAGAFNNYNDPSREDTLDNIVEMAHYDVVHLLHDNGVDLMIIKGLCDEFPNHYEDIVEDKMLQNDQRYDREHWNRQPQGHERDWYLAHDAPTMTALRQIGQNPDPIVNEQGYDNFAYDILNIDDRYLQRYLANPTPDTLRDLHERASWNMTLLDYLHNGTMFPVFNDTHYSHHTDRRDFLRNSGLPQDENGRRELHFDAVYGGNRIIYKQYHDPTPRSHLAFQTPESRAVSDYFIAKRNKVS